MNTINAFLKGEANRNKPLKVFDWVKAARLIKERNPEKAGAGLEGDWEWTGGCIYAQGKPVPRKDTYTYLASTWATPQLSLDGEQIECFVMEKDTKWNADTYWPKEALDALK